MNVREAILRAADICAKHGSPTHQIFVSQSTYDNIVDTFDYSAAVDAIYEDEGTYQETTTRLGQLAVARRLAGLRGQRFHACAWLRSRP